MLRLGGDDSTFLIEEPRSNNNNDNNSNNEKDDNVDVVPSKTIFQSWFLKPDWISSFLGDHKFLSCSKKLAQQLLWL